MARRKPTSTEEEKRWIGRKKLSIFPKLDNTINTLLQCIDVKDLLKIDYRDENRERL